MFPYLPTPSNLQAFQTGGKRCAEPSPEAAAKAKAKAAAKAKAEKKEALGIFGVCQILSKNGAYMGIPVHHKIATKMGYMIMIPRIYTDIGVLHFQTKLCILMYF